MSHDNDMRTQQGPSPLFLRGPGQSVRFMCARCKLPCQQLGSKLRHIRGLRQRVCGPCHQELTK